MNSHWTYQDKRDRGTPKVSDFVFRVLEGF